MHLLRQISATLGEGQVTTQPQLNVIPWRLRDVLPKFALNIGNGEYTSDSIRLDASDTFAIPLPEAYANTSRLSCCIRTNQTVKATIVSPDHGTSNVLIKGTNGTTNGEHHGILMWSGTVTSITLTMASGVDPALIDYFLFKIPDLSLAASWRIGSRATGVVS